MVTFNLEIPEELIAVIRALGYDVKSYFDLVFIRPLAEKYTENKSKEAMKAIKDEIDTETSDLRRKTKFSSSQDNKKIDY